MSRETSFPLGATVTVEQLESDPHELLARLRAAEPVSWMPALGGWLVTRHDLGLHVMRYAAAFTVDDPRFSTAQVIGPSMLSLDGEQHTRHRAPFVPPLRPTAVRDRFTATVQQQAGALIDELEPCGSVELRRSFAGPLAAAIVTRALGLDHGEVRAVLAAYDSIVAAVTSITVGEGVTAAGADAFAALRERLEGVIEDGDESTLLRTVASRGSTLSTEQVVSNAAVLLFGGIETTEGMICNAVVHVLSNEHALERIRAELAAGDDAPLLARAIEESLRLEPAAAMIDRYATAATHLGGAAIEAGDLVRVSIAATGRDPAVFTDPDRFDLHRRDTRRHLAFAHGPHVCLGVHLARLEASIALATVLRRLPLLRLDPDRPPAVRGLVFRKPPALYVRWD